MAIIKNTFNLEIRICNSIQKIMQTKTSMVSRKHVSITLRITLCGN